MQCKDIMSHDVQWILPRETAAAAAKLMAFHNVGLLSVCTGDGKPVGVITDRDIALRLVGEDRLAVETLVEDVMSPAVRTVTDDCSVEHVGEVMIEAGVSRLLVLNQDGHFAGIVSLADLLVHSPGKNALETARSIYARESSDRSQGHPHHAAIPRPEYFQGARDTSPNRESVGENSARTEANSVVHGGTNDLKEFPT